ncbi:protein IMPACT-B-like [Rhincodon typus]|uniref:protein IMPACT-B-like n=1 Tax=Rhincodon typus TaxID=259920 RepID=UPI00202F088D|nr:protein IMPACT-B-like [Rhincodon typus]
MEEFVNCEEHSVEFRKDIDTLVEWADRWHMRFDAVICEVKYFGWKNVERQNLGCLSALSPLQVKLLLQELYQNKKIANATHNIYAYRIYCEDKQTFLQDCEDDGETAAGGRLLHLLQILDARNVLVIVSRWYGGILLGPDRFKHINNCARNILVDEGYAELAGEGSRTSIKKKKPKNKRGK